jgi:hypothetical protein
MRVRRISTRFRRIDANQFNTNLFKMHLMLINAEFGFLNQVDFGKCIAYSAGQTAGCLNSINEGTPCLFVGRRNTRCIACE